MGEIKMQRKVCAYLLGIFISSCSFFTASVFAEVNNSGVLIKWGYKGNTGPIRWGQLSPAFVLCLEGQLQSPININRNRQFQNKPHNLVIHYQPAPLAIVDDGVTELTLGKLQTIIHDGHGIQLNFSSQSAQEKVVFENKEYHLVQFHFHSPSENALNGQTFPLEVHFVHQSADGHVLVIGIFIKAGASNPAIQKIIQNLPEVEGVEHIVSKEQINPATLLPANQEYYSFMGSLTTPPCTEGLQWIIMPHAARATPGQILLLRKAMGGDNARPVQSRNHRKIYFSYE
jgi:carbonic anhydrase